MQPPSLAQLTACAAEAARAGGTHARDNAHRRGEADRRLAHDVKLRLDVECQERCEAVVRRHFPDHGILGEESAVKDLNPAECWIIDPLDGTVNFSHGLPEWCCSVAVRREGRTVAGAVYAPMLDELFTATADGPALLNGRPIRVSDTPDLQQGMVYTGILRSTQDQSVSMNVFHRMAERFQKVRILGSAALELCYVACGRGDAYLETTIHLWDYAAGALLVECAGGRTETLGRHTELCAQFMATNGRLHEEFKTAVKPWLEPTAR